MLVALPTCSSSDISPLPPVFKGASLGQEGDESEESGEGIGADNGARMTADSESGTGETLDSETKASSSVLRAGGSSGLI